MYIQNSDLLTDLFMYRKSTLLLWWSQWRGYLEY